MVIKIKATSGELKDLMDRIFEKLREQPNKAKVLR